jgi:hypothetical protein
VRVGLSPALCRDWHQSRRAQWIEINPLALSDASMRPLDIRSSLRAQNADCARLLGRRRGAHGDEHPRLPGWRLVTASFGIGGSPSGPLRIARLLKRASQRSDVSTDGRPN